MEFQTKNPVLNGIEQKIEKNYSYVTGKTATFTGISVKTGILIAIIIGISYYIWSNLATIAPYLGGLLIGSFIVGFISVIVAGASTRMSPFFSILYAVSEGVVLGSLTAFVELAFPGIVFQALLITFAIFAFLLVTYATGIFKVGARFRQIVYTIMFGLMMYFLISFIFGLFGVNLYSQNPVVILLATIALIVVASFNLLIDFDNCKIAVEDGMSSQYEWYLSLGLLVSLVWLYVEVLRLLIILSSYFRRD